MIEQEKDKAVDVIMVIAFLAAALLTVIGIIFTAMDQTIGVATEFVHI
ncbi:MAG: hypothetical protein WBF33_15225 [Candidatus Nitrosopolaris sp.]|jgi:hypothetical protein